MSFLYSYIYLTCEMEFLHSQITKTSCHNYFKQAGTGPSRRHIQGSKISKRLPSEKLHTYENGPTGALEGAHFRNCQHFCRS